MNAMKLLLILSIGATLSACGGGGGTSFSLLADSDTFQQSSGSINDKVDILWVIDNSGSMETSQSNLASNFNSFIGDFQNKNLDFKMAITGTDAWVDLFRNQPICSTFRDGPVHANYNGYIYSSCGEHSTHNGQRVLTPSTANLTDVFVNNIQQGIYGAGDERSFQSMQAALDANSSFVRSNSYLAVIILTDEDDTSQNNEAPVGHGHSSLHSPSVYESYLNNLTGSSGATRRFSVNTIAIQDSACRDALNNSFTGRRIGSRVNALADLTGGFKANLCGNFASELNSLADNILSLATQFYLSRNPIVDTIEVRINGALVPNSSGSPNGGWQYVSESNSIVFTGDYIPEAGSSIKVDFDPVAYGS